MPGKITDFFRLATLFIRHRTTALTRPTTGARQNAELGL
jgi:hypothetical protein